MNGKLMAAMADGELLDGLRGGNAVAFEQLFERYWKPLYTALLKRIHDEAEAQDILQDLFVSLWVRREQLPDHIDWEDYLYAALRNRALNFMQASRVRLDYANMVLNRHAEPSTDGADGSLLSDDLQQIIRRATEKMPNRMKEVFLLSYSGGFTPREIADQLSLSLQTVKNHLTEARTILRQFLAHYSAETWVWVIVSVYPLYNSLINC